MKILIIGSGKSFNKSLVTKYFNECDYVISADGGASALYNYKMIPDIIIGDLDSISIEAKRFFENMNVNFERFPTKKDKTDMEISIDYALNMKCTEITLLGATGTRFDHSLANVFLLINLMNKGIKAKIIDSNNEIYTVNDSIELIKEENSYVSIIPIINENVNITTTGFEYETNNKLFELGSTLGISNEIKDNIGKINVNDGVCLVIKSKD